MLGREDGLVGLRQWEQLTSVVVVAVALPSEVLGPELWVARVRKSELGRIHGIEALWRLL
jgi:hypothetical protein